VVVAGVGLATVVAGLKVAVAGVGLATVMVGLVADRTYPPFRKSRNSYCPGAAGAFTVHVRVVTPAPTDVRVVKEPAVSGVATGVNASQSAPPPGAPVRVAVSGLPGRALVALTAKVALATVNRRALEVPPPGAGVSTVIFVAPAAAMSVARMEAVSCVADTNVVVRLAPLIRTTELVVKPVPVAVRVKAPPPAGAVAGLMLKSAGTGAGGTTVKARELEIPPPGPADTLT
jgi:hypothetical protein